MKESGKAYFRLGQALYHFKKYEESLKNLETAVSLLPGDDTGNSFDYGINWLIF